jgi:DNA-binding MarR family transcriptional regulator
LIGTTDATASRTVDALEAAGLAGRTRDPVDGRGIHVEPTARGRREVKARRERLEALVAELLRGLGPEEERRLAELLTDLNEVLSQS